METSATSPSTQERGPLHDDVAVLGGLGEVGKLLSGSLAASGFAVLDVDRQALPEGGAARRFLAGDVTNPDGALRRAISEADCVIACLPADVALAALRPIVKLMRPGALWVDTLSVKTEVCRALRELARHLEILSIDPMFAPALGWRGNVVAAIELAAGPRSAAMIRRFEEWGARVERTSAEEHDALTAAIQVATHAAVLAFGSALRELGYDARSGLRLATPPHRLMLALLDRIVNANPAVYSEIQRHHPQGDAVREAMSRALEALTAAARDSASDPLPRWFEELRLLLAPGQEDLRRVGDRAIALAAGGASEAEP